jgi:aryl-alcohol dehydrogenase-like predicted oxidoreductase
VIPGIRTVAQAEANTSLNATEPLPASVLADLEGFAWRKDFWHEEVPTT